MLLLIIFGSVLLLGFAGLILDKVFYDKSCNWYHKARNHYFDNNYCDDDIYKIYHKKSDRYETASTSCECLKYIGLIVGGACLLFYVIIIICCRIPINREYNDAVYEKQVLEYRLDNLDTVGAQTGNELLYNDIVEFNKKLRHAKRYVDSPWIGWFINEKIAGLDYIEIEGLEK